MFQHRHYAAIAASLAKLDDPDVRAMAAVRLAADFQRDNPRFDSNRFMAAARGEPINRKDAR